jgi:ferrous iron transport protein A
MIDPSASSSAPPSRVATLAAWPARRRARIVAVDAGPDQPAERTRQLADLGFVAGEQVMVVAQAWPGGDPLVVQIGDARFALRRAEASAIRVEPLP